MIYEPRLLSEEGTIKQAKELLKQKIEILKDIPNNIQKEQAIKAETFPADRLLEKEHLNIEQRLHTDITQTKP